jgi:cytochrome d ubiquinol oxidase subunit I
VTLIIISEKNQKYEPNLRRNKILKYTNAMLENIPNQLIDWSRAQFALTAIYHWLFVPLTLGLAVIMGIMETIYVRTGRSYWRQTTRFWMKLFGINFAVGVATGLILEFEFGTNWSNYSWFVGDIFGAPLAIEGIVAFFMEATFIAVMYFGWDKVSRRFHLAATWLTGLGATLSAWWILVANAWMQVPVGMQFNPDTVRNEMVDFVSVALSPFAVVKFFHSVLSSWMVGAAFVIGICCYYLIRQRHRQMALSAMKIAAIVGLTGALLTALTGDTSAYQVAQRQPMKLAAMEGLYEGGEGMGLTVIALVNPDKERYDDAEEPLLGEVRLPYFLSLLATRTPEGYVPGIRNLLDGGYPLPDGTPAPSAAEKMASGRRAIEALGAYRVAREAGDEARAEVARRTLDENMANFGYGYLTDLQQLVPDVALNFYAFRVMVGVGCYFILFFAVVLWLLFRGDLTRYKWLQWLGLVSIPLAYLGSQAGWIVAECGRQPWAIQDLLPTCAAVSQLSVGNVQVTFFLFLLIFTVLLVADVSILVRAIRQGPEEEQA